MNRSLLSMAAVASVALAGCAGVEVKDGTGSDARTTGIPFYVKVPWRIQETTLTSREIALAFTVTAETKEIETGKKSIRTLTLPKQPLHLVDTPANRAAIQQLLDDLSNLHARPDQTASVIEQAIANFVKTNQTAPLAPLSAATCRVIPLEVVSNTWSTKMQAGSQIYYFTPKNPFIGSASSEIHLGEDGTLTQANTSVTDNTASTLLSVIPVTSFLTKAWNLDSGASTPASNEAQAQMWHGPTPQKPPVKHTATIEVTVKASITPERTDYALRKATDMHGAAATSVSNAPLDLCKAMAGEDATEIVSVKTQSASNEDKDDDGKGAWKISGQLVPPKAEAPAAKK